MSSYLDKSRPINVRRVKMKNKRAHVQLYKDGSAQFVFKKLEPNGEIITTRIRLSQEAIAATYMLICDIYPQFPEILNRRTPPAIPASVIETYRNLTTAMKTHGASSWKFDEWVHQAEVIKETCAAFGCDLRELEKQQ